MTKVVHFEDYFDPEAGYQINELLRTKKISSEKVFLVCSYDMKPFHKQYSREKDLLFEKEFEVSIIRLKSFAKIGNRLIYLGLFNIIKKIKPDILYLHGFGDFKDFILFRKYNFKIFRDCHMSWIASKNKLAKIYYFMYKNTFARIINATEKYKKIFYLGVEEKEYLNKMGIKDHKLDCLPHGYNSNTMFFCADSRKTFRNEIMVDNNRVLIGYVGKLDFNKQPHLIFSIVNYLTKSIKVKIDMACHYLNLKNADEFYMKMKNRDADIILKMAKCVLSAFKRGKDQIDIFDITFKNLDQLTFTIEKSQYKELLSNCMKDLIELEEYELCAEIKKILDGKRKSRKLKEVL
jgi:hypothetical protein